MRITIPRRREKGWPELASEPRRRLASAMSSGRFEPAPGAATLGGVAVETGDATGLAIEVAPWIGGRLEPMPPEFWVGWMAA